MLVLHCRDQMVAEEIRPIGSDEEAFFALIHEQKGHVCIMF